jgi:hypothetical protein
VSVNANVKLVVFWTAPAGLPPGLSWAEKQFSPAVPGDRASHSGHQAQGVTPDLVSWLQMDLHGLLQTTDMTHGERESEAVTLLSRASKSLTAILVVDASAILSY